jgi:hypothetical protein
MSIMMILLVSCNLRLNLSSSPFPVDLYFRGEYFEFHSGYELSWQGLCGCLKHLVGRYFEVGRSSSESLLDLFLIHDNFLFYPTLDP